MPRFQNSCRFFFSRVSILCLHFSYYLFLGFRVTFFIHMLCFVFFMFYRITLFIFKLSHPIHLFFTFFLMTSDLHRSTSSVVLPNLFQFSDPFYTALHIKSSTFSLYIFYSIHYYSLSSFGLLQYIPVSFRYVSLNISLVPLFSIFCTLNILFTVNSAHSSTLFDLFDLHKPTVLCHTETRIEPTTILPNLLILRLHFISSRHCANNSCHVIGSATVASTFREAFCF